MNIYEHAMLSAINAARVERGVHALAASGPAAAAARRHAEDMATHPGLVHVGSDGTDGGARLIQEGYYWQSWREVIAWGFDGRIEPVVLWWLSSPEHRDIILSPEMVDIGVGYAVGLGPWGHYWTVDMGRRKDGALPASFVPVVAGGGG